MRFAPLRDNANSLNCLSSRGSHAFLIAADQSCRPARGVAGQLRLVARGRARGALRLGLAGRAAARLFVSRLDKHRTDLTVYTEAGAAFFDGRDPYEVTNVRGWGYLYPPLFAMLLAPLHPLPTQDQVLVWYGISLLFLWGVYRELGRIVGFLEAEGDSPRCVWAAWYPWLGIAALCTAIMPTLNCLQRGQVGVLKLYLLLLGFRLVLCGRRWPAWLGGGIVLALPIVLKLVPLLPVAMVIFVELVVWWHARRKGDSPIFAYTKIGTVPGQRLAATTAGVSVGLVLFVLLLPGALVGWQANLRHLTTWSLNTFPKVLDGQSEERSGNDHVIRNQSLQNAAYRLGNLAHHLLAAGPDDRLAEDMPSPPFFMDRPAAQLAMLVVRLAILAGLLWACVRLGQAGDGLSLTAAFSLACVAMLVVSPVARAHYFMLAAPAAMFFPWWLACRRWSRAAVVMAVTPAVLVNLHYAVMPLAGRIGLLGLGLAAWLVAAVALVCALETRLGKPTVAPPTVRRGAIERSGRPCEPRPFRNCVSDGSASYACRLWLCYVLTWGPRGKMCG